MRKDVDVEFSSGLKSIGGGAFENCSSIEEIVLQNVLEETGVLAFAVRRI